MGRPDYAVTLEDVLQHLKTLCGAVDLPLNADFESGFAAEPDGVAVNVGRAIQTRHRRPFDRGSRRRGPAVFTTRLWRWRASSPPAPRSTARAKTSFWLRAPKACSPIPPPLRPPSTGWWRFAAAGADCLFAPGVREKADIAAMVRAVAPKPLNVLMMRPGLERRRTGRSGRAADQRRRRAGADRLERGDGRRRTDQGRIVRQPGRAPRRASG